MQRLLEGVGYPVKESHFGMRSGGDYERMIHDRFRIRRRLPRDDNRLCGETSRRRVSTSCPWSRLRKKRCRSAVLRILLLCFVAIEPSMAQFGEIASLVSGLIGSGALGNLGSLAGLAGSAGSAGALAGAAGGGAASALSGAGSLYQLAQAALQLTGTGVGILNQASEGAWFPAVVEQASKNQKEFQEKLLAANTNPSAIPLTSQGFFPSASGSGAKGKELTVGPEFGTDFTAPDDYDDDDDGETTTTTTTVSPAILENIYEKRATLFPEEKEETESTTSSTRTTQSTTSITSESPRRRIRVEIPEKKKDDGDTDYYDGLRTDKHTNTDFVFSGHLDEDEDPLLPPRATNPRPQAFSSPSVDVHKERKTPDLSRLVEILKGSNLEESEIKEIISQVEANKNSKPRENWLSTTTPNPEDVDPEEAEKEGKRNRILEAHRRGIASATRLPFRGTTLSPPLRHRKVTVFPAHRNVNIVPRYSHPRTTAQVRARRLNTTAITISSGRPSPKAQSLPDLRTRAFSVNSLPNPKIHSTNAELKPLNDRSFVVDSTGVLHPSSSARPVQVATVSPPTVSVVYPTTTSPFFYHQQNFGFYQQFPQQPQAYYNVFTYPNTNSPPPSQAKSPFGNVYSTQPSPFQFGIPALQPSG
ncbi:hypothetical protein QR680_017572 [Steinernema hermaphroditum]|uniref:Uncharacterized protein n=1 Tax=Steinernema hermaphroditum TaxID=289476 RepID=A0AA39HFP8_9BILA|nr:hypothetical protein QR680_017572 [Steinernema hermaphroditum]